MPNDDGNDKDKASTSHKGGCCCLAQIGPSILNANLARLADECTRLLDAGADYLHLDVMDGSFVPNITFGHPVVKCLRQELGSKPTFDMHMMVSDPIRWITDVADAGGNIYTFHYEATEELRTAECIRKVKESGMKVGLAIKPGTPVSVIEKYIPEVDMALIMTVEPGFGGQKFMSDMMPKVAHLRKTFPNLDIEVDGGVGPSSIDSVATAGANMIVSGTAVISATDPSSVIKTMRDRLVQQGYKGKQ